MCLLEAVTAWSAQDITCLANSHTDLDNPLRQGDRLGAANGIEYAAQAMAIHGALLADSDDPPRQGYLTSVRSVKTHVSRLDHCPEPLRIQAQRLTGDDNHILYQFEIHHGDTLLLEGRASVVLDASQLSPPAKETP